ncbi:hypothetical protein BH09MYX1_BH09MYX1_03960 [soil metagenome]
MKRTVLSSLLLASTFATFAGAGTVGCSSPSDTPSTDAGSTDAVTDGGGGGSCSLCFAGSSGNSFCAATSTCGKRSAVIDACDWGFVESDVNCDARHLAPTNLGIDCRAPKNLKDVRCHDGTPQPSSIGTGIGWGTGVLRGSFIDPVTKHLVISYASPTEGALISVDVDSGARTQVTGDVLTVSQGTVKVGTGLEGITYLDAKAGPDGYYVIAGAATGGGPKPVLLRIDPATGNRTTLYDARTTLDACKLGAVSVDFASMKAYASTRDLDPYIVVAADGTVYSRVYGNDFNGMASFKAGVCTILSAYSLNVPALNKGTGAIMGPITGTAYQNGTLYALTNPDLLVKFDLTTGNRTVVSSHVSGDLLGKGDGLLENFLDVGPDPTELVTTGPTPTASGYSPSNLPSWVVAKTANGDRTAAFPLAEPYRRPVQVFAHPTKTDRWVLTARDTVFLYEPASGNVVRVSY